MNVRLWGTRGSIPAPGPATERYGGNTSCVEVRLEDGTLIIIDAGTGIRGLGAALGSCEAKLLLSHYHWDHIQGMPFFIPAYSGRSHIEVLGPEHGGAGPEAHLCVQMNEPQFPAPARDWKGISGWKTISPETDLSVGAASIRIGDLCHRGRTFGFRIQEDDRVFVYMSDNEPRQASPEAMRGIIELASEADLLLHDCQFSEAEYQTRQHWGHSTPAQAVHVASEAGVRRLLLFHHDPSHGDEQVESLASEAANLAGGIDIAVGREGESLRVGHPAIVGL